MRLGSAAVAAAFALGPCAFTALVATGCNALSGIGDFAVGPEASGDATVVGDGTGSDDAPAKPGDGGNVDAELDATDGAADGSMSDAANEAGTDATADSRVDGRADASNATDADGGCPITHSNGIGQSFADCAPLGTYNATQAFEACTAFTGSMSLCANDPITCGGGDQVCSSGAMCACWRYNGTNVGHVLNNGATCACLGSSTPTWN